MYGPWDALEREYAAWCKTRHNTFHYVQWGWEQDRNTLQAYGFAPDNQYSQTDLLLPPGESPITDPWRLDYAADPLPATIGKPARGVLEPTVGALLDFHLNPRRGEAGIGLGVLSPDAGAAGLHADRSTQFFVIVRQGRWLVLDGADLGLGTRSFEIPAKVQAAMAADADRIGLTVVIAQGELPRRFAETRRIKCNARI